MKLLAILTTTAALLLTLTLAAPVDSTSSTSDSAAGGKTPQSAATASNNGSPQCKSDMMSDLCLSDNSHAYCDATGFHNDFMKSCQGNCFCA